MTLPPMRGAVLFIVFNRPAITARTFETIRAARPPRLYVAADAPRADRLGEADLCTATRAAATAIDWPCQLRTLFHPANLGAKHAVEGAITWFFAHEAQGIVIEEDMLAAPSFFAFTEEILDRYADDRRIGLVGGLNLLPQKAAPRASYAFSNYFHMCGWGTWRHVWAEHDVGMSAWPKDRRTGLLGRVLDGRRFAVRHWTRTFDRTWAGDDAQWDNKLQFSLWRQGRVSVIPATNMVVNIGFGPGATTNRGPLPAFMRVPAQDIAFPLTHPHNVAVEPGFDRTIERDALRIGLAGEARHQARWLLGPALPLLKRVRYGGGDG